MTEVLERLEEQGVEGRVEVMFEVEEEADPEVRVEERFLEG